MAPAHRSGLATSTFYTFADVGAGIGPLLCGLLVPVAGYSGMYITVAAVAAGCLVLYYSLYGRHANKDCRYAFETLPIVPLDRARAAFLGVFGAIGMGR